MPGSSNGSLTEHFRMSIASALCVSLGLTVSACVTSLDQQHWDESLRGVPLVAGTARMFNADSHSTLRAVEDAIVAADLRQARDCPAPDYKNHEVMPRCTERAVARVDDHTSVIYARGRERGWNGKQVRVVIKERAPNQTIVSVVSKYRTETITGRPGDYSATILNEVARTLSQ